MIKAWKALKDKQAQEYIDNKGYLGHLKVNTWFKQCQDIRCRKMVNLTTLQSDEKNWFVPNDAFLKALDKHNIGITHGFCDEHFIKYGKEQMGEEGFAKYLKKQLGA